METTHKKDIVLITDIGAVDPDDIFALQLILTFLPDSEFNLVAVITTHHYPEKKAQIAKLLLTEFGIPEIPVYIGCGTPYSDEFNEEHRKAFFADNQLFPRIFGYPKSVRKDDEPLWFENFAKAYVDSYGQDNLDKLETFPNGHEFLVNELSKHSKENPLGVISIAPLHDLQKIPAELYGNMELYCMGGGFEEMTSEFMEGKVPKINVTRAGYNWGICPGPTREVLDKLSKSNTKMKLISPAITRKYDVSISPEIYKMWMDLAQDGNTLQITRAILNDWLHCMKGNKLQSHKNLCDPLAVYIALNPDLMSKLEKRNVRITMQNEEHYEDYLKPIEGKPLMRIFSDENGNVELICTLIESITPEIISRLEKIMFGNLQKYNL